MKPPRPPVRPPIPARPMVAPPRPAGPPGRAKGIPPLSALDPVPDPLAGLPETDDPQESALAELGALELGFRQRAKTEQNRFQTETDTEHWFAVDFETREQKETFLAELARRCGVTLADLGDKYLHGLILASLMGIDLPEGGRRYNTGGKPDKTLRLLR